MGRIEAESRQIAERTDFLTAIRGADRVAAVFDKPKPVPAAEIDHLVAPERVSESVGDHQSAGPARQGRFKLGDVDVVRGELDVDEDRSQAVLDRRVDRRWKSGGDG